MRKISSTNFVNEVFLQERCVLNKVIKIIGRRWMSEILLLIEKEVCRFSILKEKLDGISDNVLSQSLNELVKSGLLQKRMCEEDTFKFEYGLTEIGKSLVDQLHELCRWGKENVEE